MTLSSRRASPGDDKGRCDPATLRAEMKDTIAAAAGNELTNKDGEMSCSDCERLMALIQE